MAEARDLWQRKRVQKVTNLFEAEDDAGYSAGAVVLLERLQRVTASLARALTTDQVAEVIVTQGVTTLRASTGMLGCLSDEGSEIVIVRSTGFPTEVIAPVRRIPLTAPAPATEVARTRKSLWIESPEELARRFPEGTEFPGVAFSKAWAVIPLVVNEQILGVLSLSFRTPRTFQASERAYTETLAQQWAQALDRARLHEAERTARQRAEVAIRSRDEFLSIAAHELKTPMAGIKAAAQLMARFLDRGQLDADRLRHYTQTITQSTDRLAALTNDLLDISRIQSGRLELERREVDLGKLIRGIAERFRDQLDDRYDLQVVIPTDAGSVRVDPSRLEQVLVNLLDNAAKYSPDGGTIRLSIEARPEQVILRVSDSGIGLSAEARETIFQPFSRASNAIRECLPGMGLGLYICRTIVERHGGRLWAESPGENQGTTMVIELPR